MRLLHKGESRCCFRDSASVTYGGMLPSDLTLSTLRFILSAKSGQSCKQDCETVDFCNSLIIYRSKSDLPRGEVVMRGVPIGSPSRSGYALRLGARIRPTALRSFLPKPENETSFSSVVTSAGGDTKDPYCEYTSFVTSAGGDTKYPYCGYMSFVTSAGGQTNHSPQSFGLRPPTGGTRRRPLIDPLWVGLGTANTFDSIEGAINWRIAVR